MEVEILAFGITRDIVGGNTFRMTLEKGGSVKDLKQSLFKQHPKMKQLRSLMIAVDNEYVEDGFLLTDKQEIALIPPVSGG